MTWDGWPFESAKLHICRYGGLTVTCRDIWPQLLALVVIDSVNEEGPGSLLSDGCSMEFGFLNQRIIPCQQIAFSFPCLSWLEKLQSFGLLFSCSTPQISSVLLRSEIKGCFKIHRRPKDLTKETAHWSLMMTNPCRFIFFLPKFCAFGWGGGGW